jgi:FkbM family methyltransferase
MRNLGTTATILWRKFCWSLIHWGPRRDFTVQSANGLLTADSNDWLIGKYLYTQREFESKETGQALELLKKEGLLSRDQFDGTLVNVGANIGMTVIRLVRDGAFNRAWAFEPTPNTYRLLVQNIKQNNLADQILTFQVALSAGEGSCDFELSRDNSGDNRVCLTKTPGFISEEKRRTIKVQTKSLDGLLRDNSELKLEPVKLVWIDIQGHEGHFFHGAKEFFSRGIPAVSEIWPYAIQRSGMSLAEFALILSQLFSSFYILGVAPEKRMPISDIGTVFQQYSGPRDMCVALLLP